MNTCFIPVSTAATVSGARKSDTGAWWSGLGRDCCRERWSEAVTAGSGRGGCRALRRGTRQQSSATSWRIGLISIVLILCLMH